MPRNLEFVLKATGAAGRLEAKARDERSRGSGQTLVARDHVQGSRGTPRLRHSEKVSQGHSDLASAQRGAAAGPRPSGCVEL